MSFRLPSLAVVSLALVGSLFAAAPAHAASAASLGSSTITMSSSGYGKTWVRCSGKSTCSGTIWVDGSYAQKRSYRIKARSGAFVTFRDTRWKSRPKALLRISGDSRRVELAAVRTGRITGRITKAANGGPTASAVEVELWRLGTHHRDRLVGVRNATSGSFSFNVAMGRNNKPSARYKLHVIGTVNGQRRSWWWRGSGGGRFYGASRDMSAATTIKVTRARKFTYTTNARYSAIRGRVTTGSKPVAGTEVTLIGRPPYWSKSAKVMRDYDVMSCANVYGRDNTNSAGYYEIGFVPVTSLRTYATKATGSQWNNRWGTCHAAVNYRKNRKSTPRMHALPGGQVTQNLNTAAGRTATRVRLAGYQGPSSTARVDRYLTVREYAPGRKILSSDVARATSSNKMSLGEGYYWFEVGRRTGCSAWYGSRYKDNNGYFNGLDRGFERWKARNYRMYRQHCRAYTSGAYKLVYVSGKSKTVQLTNSKGGWVTGKVSNPKIKPRTELMIRLSSSDGTKVYRTAMTDGGGRFKVTGLASGRYTVVVNSDSWRGISRSFKGTKSVKVSRGHGKSIGTLRFRQ